MGRKWPWNRKTKEQLHSPEDINNDKVSPPETKEDGETTRSNADVPQKPKESITKSVPTKDTTTTTAPPQPEFTTEELPKQINLKEEELKRLMVQINHLLTMEKIQRPKWQKKYKNEDPRSIFYHSMLKRVGLPEKHARFAPWFYKSSKLKLSRRTSIMFAAMEKAYLETPQKLDDIEVALLNYEKFMKNIETYNLHPRDLNQAQIQRAYRECTFTPPKLNYELQMKEKEVHFAFRKENPDDQIPLVRKANAPPGLAAPVAGKLESHGNHLYFNYNGRWKSGEMRAPVGTYTFADGGTHCGAWKSSIQCGSGVAEYPNGCKYTGGWKEGKYNGYGVMEMKNGTKYEGSYRDGLRHGKGKLIFPSGATFEGNFFLGQRSGTGIAISSLGHKYVGAWLCNKICGAGTMYLLNDKKYHNENWEPCVFGEAIELAKKELATKMNKEWTERQNLYRVRDDLRALDLQIEYRYKKCQRILAAEEAEKRKLKQLRKEQREAQNAAKEAFLSEMLKDLSSEEDDEEGDDDEDEDDEEDDDDEDEEEDDDENEDSEAEDKNKAPN